MELVEIEKNMKRYEKLADKNYWLYQESGDPKYDKANEKYSDLADIYRMAYKYQQEEDTDRTRRLRNVSDYIRTHVKERKKDNYTKAEVLELVKTMKQFAV